MFFSGIDSITSELSFDNIDQGATVLMFVFRAKTFNISRSSYASISLIASDTSGLVTGNEELCL